MDLVPIRSAITPNRPTASNDVNNGLPVFNGNPKLISDFQHPLERAPIPQPTNVTATTSSSMGLNKRTVSVGAGDVILEKRNRRLHSRIRKDEDADKVPSPVGSSFRFSGSIHDEDVIAGGKDEESIGAKRRELELDTPPYMFYTPANRNQKKGQKGMTPVAKIPGVILANRDLRKYWAKRYELFSKYDEGIKLDRESWFSVTPENIAIHIADRCSSTYGVIIDAFCGCGGNTIQFAKHAEKVIAIDIDPVKINNARHNAKIYGVEDRITFMVADFMEIAPTLQGEVVFLSPPWGGPGYGKATTFDLETMIPMDGLKLFKLAQGITRNIAYYVPRNVDRHQVALLSGPGGTVEIESNSVGGHVKAVTVYYGELIRSI